MTVVLRPGEGARAKISARRSFCVLSLITITVGRGEAAPSVDASQTYADTCIETESGDTGGAVVTLSRPRARPVVSVIWSEGALEAPVFGRGKRDHGRLRFAAPSPAGGIARFAGRVDRLVLVGTLFFPSEHPRHVVLPRTSLDAAVKPRRRC